MVMNLTTPDTKEFGRDSTPCLVPICGILNEKKKRGLIFEGSNTVRKSIKSLKIITTKTINKKVKNYTKIHV